MSKTDPIGGRSWWLDHLQAHRFEVREDQEQGFLEITSKGKPILSSGSPEKILKDELLKTGVFPGGTVREVKVRLGHDVKKIDVLASIGDIRWVIECKILATTTVLDIERVGQAIGQVLILTYLEKLHYREHLSSKLMPAICTWTIGSGSLVVKDICRMIGVSIIEVLEERPPQQSDMPPAWGSRFIRIYYLDDKSPRPFCEEWLSD